MNEWGQLLVGCAVVLAIIYIGLVYFRPAWTLAAPFDVELDQRPWLDQTAWLYNATLIGFFVDAVLAVSGFDALLCIWAGASTAVALSARVDWERGSHIGLALDTALLISFSGFLMMR